MLLFKRILRKRSKRANILPLKSRKFGVFELSCVCLMQRERLKGIFATRSLEKKFVALIRSFFGICEDSAEHLFVKKLLILLDFKAHFWYNSVNLSVN